MVQNELQKKLRDDADRLEKHILIDRASNVRNSRTQNRFENTLNHSMASIDSLSGTNVVVRNAQAKFRTAQRSLYSSKGFDMTAMNKPAGTQHDGIWNKVGFTKTPKSSYGMAY